MLISNFEPTDRFTQNLFLTSCHWTADQYRNFQFPTISNNNMADVRTNEVQETRATFNVGSRNDAL
jgi:hypothetical protein